MYDNSATFHRCDSEKGVLLFGKRISGDCSQCVTTSGMIISSLYIDLVYYGLVRVTFGVIQKVHNRKNFHLDPLSHPL